MPISRHDLNLGAAQLPQIVRNLFDRLSHSLAGGADRRLAHEFLEPRHMLIPVSRDVVEYRLPGHARTPFSASRPLSRGCRFSPGTGEHFGDPARRLLAHMEWHGNDGDLQAKVLHL